MRGLGFRGFVLSGSSLSGVIRREALGFRAAGFQDFGVLGVVREFSLLWVLFCCGRTAKIVCC